MQVYTLLSFLNIFTTGTILINRSKPRQRRFSLRAGFGERFNCIFSLPSGTIESSGVNGEELSELEKTKIINALLENYDNRIRAQMGTRLDVVTNFYVQGMSSVNQEEMDYDVTIFFRNSS